MKTFEETFGRLPTPEDMRIQLHCLESTIYAFSEHGMIKVDNLRMAIKAGYKILEEKGL